MTRREFEKLVEEAIKNISEKFRKRLDNVDIVIEEYPPPSFFPKIKSGLQIFGLYQGVPKTKRTHSYSGVLPDKITIFQKPIEKIGGNSKDKIRQIVKKTVRHEIAHHFGFSEKEVRELEKKWKGIQKS